MSASPTLNSRLRVLVAKAYKAEKLYASIRNQNSFNQSGIAEGSLPGSRADSPKSRAERQAVDRLASSAAAESAELRGPTGSATLSVFANDVRAKEWQRSHFQLRTALNEILAESAGTRAVQELIELRDRFGAKAAECTALVERETGELLEIARRKEFAHCLKLALELVRHNARAQAYSVIVSELNSILDSSSLQVSGRNHRSSGFSHPGVGKGEERVSPDRPESSAKTEHAGVETSAAAQVAATAATEDAAAIAVSNVIPFSRRAASGRRR
jgi:hypothetical protein